MMAYITSIEPNKDTVWLVINNATSCFHLVIIHLLSYTNNHSYTDIIRKNIYNIIKFTSKNDAKKKAFKKLKRFFYKPYYLVECIKFINASNTSLVIIASILAS